MALVIDLNAQEGPNWLAVAAARKQAERREAHKQALIQRRREPRKAGPGHLITLDEVRAAAERSKAKHWLKSNDFHDELGRFASGSSGAAGAVQSTSAQEVSPHVDAPGQRGLPGMEAENQASLEAAAKRIEAEKPQVSERVKKMLEVAAKVEFTDEHFIAPKADISRRDYDDIEETLSLSETNEMEEAINQARSDYEETAMQDYEPDVNRRDVADEAGWAQHDDLKEKAKDLIETLNLPDEEVASVQKLIEDAVIPRRDYGESALATITLAVKDGGASQHVIDALEGLEKEANETIDEKVQEAADAARESFAENLGDDFDSREAEHDWLSNFYDDDERNGDRFQSSYDEDQEKKWGIGSDGDRTYLFPTAFGGHYQIWAQSGRQDGLENVTIGFSDSAGSYSITGKAGPSGAAEVFRNVSTAVSAYVLHEKPELLSFTAAEASRSKLYDHLVRTTAKAFPDYRAVVGREGDHSQYGLIRRDMLPEFEASLKARGHLTDVEVLVKSHRAPARGETWRYLQPVVDLRWFNYLGWLTQKAGQRSKAYNPDQERVPAGQHGGGEFGSGTGGGAPPLIHQLVERSLPGLHAAAAKMATKIAGLAHKYVGGYLAHERDHIAHEYHHLEHRYGKPFALAVIATGITGTVGLAAYHVAEGIETGGVSVAMGLGAGATIAHLDEKVFTAPLIAGAELYLHHSDMPLADRIRFGLTHPGAHVKPAIRPARGKSFEAPNDFDPNLNVEQVYQVGREFWQRIMEDVARDAARQRGESGEESKAFNEADHPRGQPENAGEFGPGGGGHKPVADKPAAGPAPAAAPAAEKPTRQSPIERAAAEYKEQGTKAPAFKAWFGDWEGHPTSASKVVNDKGEPQQTGNLPATGSMVLDSAGKPVAVYHGTAMGGFDKFDPKKMGRDNLYGDGFYFTEDKQIAESYEEKGAKVTLAELQSIVIPEPRRQEYFADYRKLIEDRYKDFPIHKVDALKGVDDERDKFLKNGQVYELVQTKFQGVKSPSPVYEDFQLTAATALEKKYGYQVNPRRELKTLYLNIRNPKNFDDVPDDKEIQALIDHAEKTPRTDGGGKGEFYWKHIFDDFTQPADGSKLGYKNIKVPKALENANPLTAKSVRQMWEQIKKYPAAKAANGETYGFKQPVKADGKMTFENLYFILTDAGQSTTRKPAITSYLKEQGHDGITHIGGFNIGTHEHRVWIAFAPDQIKASDNRGTFSPKTDDIRKSLKYSPDQPRDHGRFSTTGGSPGSADTVDHGSGTAPHSSSQDKQALKSTPVTHSENLGGDHHNAVVKLDLKDGTHGIFKPQSVTQDNARPGISGMGPEREAVCSDVAEVIGMNDLVPSTVIREIETPPRWDYDKAKYVSYGVERGSLQKFVDDAQVAAGIWDSTRKFDSQQDEQRAGAFDYLMGNSDRYGANWMIDGNERLHLIDNGICLPNSNSRAPLMNAQILMHLEQRDAPIPEEVQHWDGSKIEDAIRAHGFDQSVIDATHERLAALKKADTFGQLKEEGPIQWVRRFGRSDADMAEAAEEFRHRNESPSDSDAYHSTEQHEAVLDPEREPGPRTAERRRVLSEIANRHAAEAAARAARESVKQASGKPAKSRNKSRKGGQGSGNFGHDGRPGETGGSGGGGKLSVIEKYKPASPDDLKYESIFLWHGTTENGADKILSGGALKEGSRGLNAAASTKDASQYPEETGSEFLVLLRAETESLTIDPNDQTGETVRDGLFPDSGYGSSVTVGKHEIAAVFDVRNATDKALEKLQNGQFMAAEKLGATMTYPSPEQSRKAKKHS